MKSVGFHIGYTPQAYNETVKGDVRSPLTVEAPGARERKKESGKPENPHTVIRGCNVQRMFYRWFCNS